MVLIQDCAGEKLCQSYKLLTFQIRNKKWTLNCPPKHGTLNDFLVYRRVIIS